jgi:hypothetical protein
VFALRSHPTPRQSADEEDDEVPNPGMMKKMYAYLEAAINTKEKKGGDTKKQKTSGGMKRREFMSLDDLGINTDVQAKLQNVLSLGQADIALKQLAEANPDVKGGFGELAVFALDKQRERPHEAEKDQEERAESKISDIEVRSALRFLFQPLCNHLFSCLY